MLVAARGSVLACRARRCGATATSACGADTGPVRLRQHSGNRGTALPARWAVAHPTSVEPGVGQVLRGAAAPAADVGKGRWPGNGYEGEGRAGSRWVRGWRGVTQHFLAAEDLVRQPSMALALRAGVLLALAACCAPQIFTPLPPDVPATGRGVGANPSVVVNNAAELAAAIQSATVTVVRLNGAPGGCREAARRL